MNISTFLDLYPLYSEIMNIKLDNSKENTRKFIEKRQKYRGAKRK